MNALKCLFKRHGAVASSWLYHHLYKKTVEPDEAQRKIFFSALHQALERNPHLYRLSWRKKKSGKQRPILTPNQSLMVVQKAIIRLIKRGYERPPCVFGFSGGSVKGALAPHAVNRWPIFCADVREAFPNVGALTVFNFWKTCGYGYYTALFLTALTTWPNPDQFGKVSLPQGAPTSPWLFDACFKPIDCKLQELAERIGGCYTRYADNIFLSAPHFPIKLLRDIERGTTLSPIRHSIGLPIFRTNCNTTSFGSPFISSVFSIVQRGYKLKYILGRKRLVQLGDDSIYGEGIYNGYPTDYIYSNYTLHKSFLWSPQSGIDFLGLGLRIRDGQIHNNRGFKDNLRYLVKRLSWQLANRQPFEEVVWPTYLHLNGMMGFAIRETLSANLLAKIENLLEQVEAIRYSGPSGTRVNEIKQL